MLWHALAYARRRWWFVFPCVPGGKVPLTSHGFKDASCSKEVITDWWLRWPNANIGLVIPDNHIILDIDPRNGGSVNGALPGTRTVRTPAGGLHLYYWTLTNGTAYTKEWRPGIDVKAPGKGYVLLPPSKTGLGQYEWVDRGTMALLPPSIHIDIKKNDWQPVTTITSTSNSSAALSWALQELAMAREGSRNDTLFRVTTFLVRVIAAEDFNSALKKIEAMALSIGLDGYEVYRTMRSAYEAAGGEPIRHAAADSTAGLHSPPASSLEKK